MSTVSKGLRSVLGVDTGKISAKGGTQKKSETNEAQNFIEKTVNQEILNHLNTWDEGKDYAEKVYVSHEGKVYKSQQSVSKGKNPSEPNNSNYWTHIKADEEIDTAMSNILSFDADMVRKEIIAWGLGRVAADYQLDIDNTESYWDQWTSGLDFGISAINTLSNFFTGSSTHRSLVKVGDSYVMMAQDAAEDSDNTNFLYQFVKSKLDKEHEKLGYGWSAYFTGPSPILSCINAIGDAADKAMEEIADDKVDPGDNSPERSVLYAKEISKIKQIDQEGRHEKKKSIVQNEIVDKVALYIANYYMISSFVTPYGGRFRGYINIKNKQNKYYINEEGSGTDIEYKTESTLYGQYKLTKSATEEVLWDIYNRNKYKDPEKTEDKDAIGNLLPNQPYHLLLPMKAPDDKNIELFLEVVDVKGNDTNGAEVEVKIKLPEAIKESLSSSIVHSGFNFTFTIPKEIYEEGLGAPLTTTDNKLSDNGKVAQQVFIDIAHNFVKAINPIREANPIIGYAEMFKNSAPDFMDSSKLFIELWRSIKFHKNNTNKGEFERAADCYGAIPTVLEHSLAYIKSGHYFDDANSDDNFIKDI